LLALCALAEDPSHDKLKDAQTQPPAAIKLPSFNTGLNAEPVQLPPFVVTGAPDHFYQDLIQAFSYEKMTESHALWQKALTKKSRVAVILPPEEGSNHTVALPLLRSSW
jgi:hypothetical protein